MRAIHLLLGCAVGLSAISTCAAAGVDNSTASATHMSGENGSHDALPASDDSTSGALHSRENSPSSSSSAHASSSNNPSNTDTSPVHFGDRSSVSPAHRDNLGWQSLLPGSIQ